MGAARRWVGALLVGVALVAGCGGEDPLGALLEHQEAVVALLEARVADPAAAGAAAAQYVAAHREELDRLKAQLLRIRLDSWDDPHRAANLALDHQEALRRVGERTLALRQHEALMAEPRVWAALAVFRGP